MPTWEETKRNMQMAFLDTAKDIHSSISDTYQQILMRGHIFPITGNDSLTQQIADDVYREPEQDIGGPDYQHIIAPGHDPDQGIEPEEER